MERDYSVTVVATLIALLVLSFLFGLLLPAAVEEWREMLNADDCRPASRDDGTAGGET